MDIIEIKDLLVAGILGVNPEERLEPQDILVNVKLWVDTRPAARTDSIDEAVNYRSISKAIIAHIQDGAPGLVERLAGELAELCLDADPRIAEVQISVEKPGALRFARSVGVTIRRAREGAPET